MICQCGTTMDARKRRGLYGLTRVCWQCPQCLRTRIRFGRNRDVEIERLPWVVRPRPKRAGTKRRREYNAYLTTPRWKEVRVLVLARDFGLCQLMMQGCTEEATEVHHENYTQFGKGGEAEAETCVAVCRRCNQREREQRIAKGVLG